MATLVTKRDSKQTQSSIKSRSKTPIVQRKCSCGGRCSSCRSKVAKAEGSPYLQAKLKVGAPDDQFEREADQMADQVMRMPERGLDRQVDRKEEEEERKMTTESAVLQRQEIEEEEPLQGKFESVQRQSPEEEEEVLQGKFTTSVTPAQHLGDVGEAANRTRMPGRLRAGLEALSGMDLSGIRVHTNSFKPAQLNALAYTQGQDIHVGPGQEQHLPHEGWHAVQQMQGRVKPTIQAKSLSINDDAGLEREADVMGTKALQMKQAEQATTGAAHQGATSLQLEVETKGEPEVPDNQQRPLNIGISSNDLTIQRAVCPGGWRRCENDPFAKNALKIIKETTDWLENNVSNPNIDRAIIRELVQQTRTAVSALRTYCKKIKGTCASGGANPMIASTTTANPAAMIGLLLLAFGVTHLATTSRSRRRDPVEESVSRTTKALRQALLAQTGTILMAGVIHDHIVNEARDLAIALGLAATASTVTREQLCEMLRRMKENARNTDTDKWEKIIATEKGLGCRNIQKRE